MTGKLSIVATPIGSLDDITIRALGTLRRADLILAEDTRRTRILTRHHGIETRLRAYHAHSSDETLSGLLRELEAGAHFALVSDAGTPLVSDPGSSLVDAARDLGITVEHLPGASAVLTALCVAGLRCDDFRFVGFIARSGARRRASIDAIASSESTTVMFESPNRTHDTLAELGARLAPTRRVAMCRELTKMHEQVVRGTVAEVLAQLPEELLGEVTLIVEGTPRREDETVLTAEDVDTQISAMLARGIAPKAIAKSLADAAGVSIRDLYKRVVELSQTRTR